MIESSMIIFNKDATRDEIAVPGRQGWIDRNNKFLEPYKTPKGKGVDCAGGEANTGEGEYCKFDLSSLGECAEANYGFDTNSPCLILKLNKIYGLVPDYYNSSVDDMPDDLKTRIDAAQEKNQIWVSCKGENPADNEGVESFEYFPAHAGFSSSYFPYLNQEGYQSPLVAVKLHNVNVGQVNIILKVQMHLPTLAEAIACCLQSKDTNLLKRQLYINLHKSLVASYRVSGLGW